MKDLAAVEVTQKRGAKLVEMGVKFQELAGGPDASFKRSDSSVAIPACQNPQ